MDSIHGHKVTIKQGEIHDYLGIYLNWSVDGQVTVSMIKYMYKILDDFIEVIEKTAKTLARNNIF